MVTYKTIVVPTDGSENAKRALEHALAVADRNKAELIVVHVANIVSAISNFDQTPISGGYVSEQIAEDMEETGKEIDDEIRSIINERYQKALSILNENRDKLEEVTRILLEKETIMGDEFEAIMRNEHI